MALGFSLNQVTLLKSALKIGKTKNSHSENNMKFAGLLPDTNINSPQINDLTFNTGNILKIWGLENKSQVSEIIDFLKNESENRPVSHCAKPTLSQFKSEKMEIYIKYLDRLDCVFSL